MTSSNQRPRTIYERDAIAQAKTYPALDVLREPKEIEKQIRALKAQIKATLETLEPGGINYEQDRVQTSPRDRFADVMGEVYDLEAKVEKLYDQLDKSKRRVLLLLDQVTDKDTRIIINLHDVLEFSMDDITEVVFMSRSKCYDLRSQGLQEISLDDLDDDMWYGDTGDL